jgi:retinol dehydrogenase-12
MATATSMKGKRTVLTGASRGIGRETALALGKLGADLSIVVRDAERGKAVAEEVRAVKKAPAGRIVNVASEAHHRGSLVFDDLMGEKKYAGWFAYSASKLANILFTAELARRLEGTKVTTNSLHPGVIASGFAHNNGGVVGFLAKLASPFLMSSEDGAKTTLFLATDPSVAGTSGLYFSKSKPKTPSREARDAAVAKRLWDVSEALVAK